MPHCHALDEECTIKNPNAKSCIECIYIARYGAKDQDDLHNRIIKLFSIDSDIDRNKLQEIVKTVNEKLQDDVEAKERMDALSKELSDIPYEDLKKKTTVKSDTKRTQP